ncbi:MAG: WecB/TagA/CpsF family glycosyltransferase [Verrucomicrobia bacterium]|jgi:exopolysaccharide biosynthesis WecB/TagA/CpsF family protein|nr:WecB/TagA/CpsF family glycosyltransferase [Verrucomicrobiota bacterium]MBT7068455.1 WecB/TagA/CpsF family glycosyltransferase [Verrucomicrobiota bacterium]MBT7699135.1 WecB/TagA/CpsF family glycosyltransferase [Verrucomicrobiota bacterium]
MPDRPTLSVLVVGQTPPPVTGQAIMIDNLVRGKYDHVALHHVRMNFSHHVSSIGRFHVRKLVHLPALIMRIWWTRLRHRCRILCYPPAGQTPNAVYRDIAILLAVRPCFQRTVFYFHAGGVSELVATFPRPLKRLAERAYGRAACSIRPSALNPDDGAAFGSAMNEVVPNAIEDVAARYPARRDASARPRLLFVGILYESKGVMVLLKACAMLAERGQDFDVVFAGAWGSDAFRKQAEEFVATNGLAERVHFAGVLTGDSKWQAYREADIFCFPSYFESETFGLVVLEAMQFELPVVATRWRGIPSLVNEDATGLLVATQDHTALSEAIQRLLDDPPYARDLGRRGREAFCAHFSLPAYCKAIEQLFLAAVAPPPPRRVTLGNVACTTHTPTQFLAEINALLSDPTQHPRTILCVNAHIHNLAQRDTILRTHLNAARLVTADGMSVVWALRYRHEPMAGRCNMTEVFRAFLADKTMPPSTAVLVGCTADDAAAAATHIAGTTAHCRVVSIISGFEEMPTYQSHLQQQGPVDMILVGAGTPRSEALVAQISAWHPSAIVWHIGAGTIRMLAGSVREAPVWMRRTGLQWLHRLCVDPVHMWRRYVLGNPAFVWRVLRYRRRGSHGVSP